MPNWTKLSAQDFLILQESGVSLLELNSDNKVLRKLRLIKSLSTAPRRTCYSLHKCNLCNQSITYGQKYMDRGYGRRGHTSCMPWKALGEAVRDTIE